MGKQVMARSGAYFSMWKLKELGQIKFLESWDPRLDAEVTDVELTKNRHQRLMGQATDIFWNVITRGGTEEEVERAAKYALIVMDARKYQLNVDKAYLKFNMQELKEKYVRATKRETCFA